MAVDVSDVVVGKAPGHLADGVGLPDVGEELVAHPLALAGTLDDAGNVDERDGRLHRLGRVEHLGQHVEPLVRHPHDTDVGLDRRERVIGRHHVIASQRVEQG